MSHYIVERRGKRYGTFVTRDEAQRWAEDNLEGSFGNVVPLTDKSEAELPHLNVGSVVRAKDKRDRTGRSFFVPGGSEGVVTAKHDTHVSVVFHAPHDHAPYEGAPEHGWACQHVDRRDLLKVDRDY